MQIPVHVVIDGEIAVGAVGVAPVDEIDIDAATQQATDQRPIGLQIEHVGTIHQRVADDERHAHPVFGCDVLEGRVAVQRDFVFAIDLGLGRGPDLDIAATGERLQSATQPLSEGFRFFHELLLIEFDAAHRRAPAARLRVALTLAFERDAGAAGRSLCS